MVNLPCLKGSCPNFLRPTCSYTECQLSFQTGSCPTERTTASYSSCLYLILLTSLFTRYCTIQWMRYLVSLGWFCCRCSTFRTPSFSGFFPEPCSISESSGTQQGSGTVIQYASFSYAPLLMLPELPACSGVLCPLTSSSDHTPSLWSELYR